MKKTVFAKIRLKMPEKWRPLCLSPIVQTLLQLGVNEESPYNWLGPDSVQSGVFDLKFQDASGNAIEINDPVDVDIPGMYHKNQWFTMTSSNGSIFRVTGALWGEFTGLGWITHTNASDGELYVSSDLRLNQHLSK